MGKYRRRQTWWLDEISWRRNYSESVPFFYLLFNILILIRSIIGSVTFNMTVSGFLSNYLFFLAYNSQLIVVPLIVYLYRKKDLDASLNLIKIFSLISIFRIISIKISSYSFGHRFYFDLSFILVLVVYLIFFVLCTNHKSMSEFINKKLRLTDRILLGTLILQYLLIYIQEAIRVHIYYQHHTGFSFTSDSSIIFLMYLVFLIPLFVFNTFMKSTDRIYVKISVVYILVLFMLNLGYETLDYFLTLKMSFFVERSFSFRELLSKLLMLSSYSSLFIASYYKLSYWDKNKRNDISEINDNKKDED